MKAIPTVKLNSGYDVPVLGLGTWQSEPGQVKAAVEYAIGIGYRHIDCALIYENEKEIGEAIANKIKDGTVTRDQLFVTSKLWCTYNEPDMVEQGCRESLSDLGLDYLDLYLMHYPMGFQQDKGTTAKRDENKQILFTERDYVDTWKAMEKLVEKGMVRSIGVSNFNMDQLKRVLELGSIKPVTNQVECHPYLTQEPLSKFCKQHSILITAYSPFASGKAPDAAPGEPPMLENQKLIIAAKKFNKTVPQMLLKYQLARGHITIPKSVNFDRIKANMDIFDFNLDVFSLITLNGLNKNGRIVTMDFCKKHKYFPF